MQLTVEHSITIDLNGKNLTITLGSANGIKLQMSSVLTIMDSSPGANGTLTVTNLTPPTPAYDNGAAINTTNGTLIIESGNVTATGGENGAGIGGGNGRMGGIAYEI